MTGRWPDFILAGAMRAGTTALAQRIAAHPACGVSSNKEPSYFAIAHGALSFTGPGDQWFAAQHTTTAEQYRALFADFDPAATVGEASAMYLALDGAAATIAADVPTAKIILTLRDPAARAHSAFWYLKSHGREPEATFEEGLRREEPRRAEGFGPMWWYLQASRYAAAVSAYQSQFGAGNVHVVLNEELRSRPEQVLEQVWDFLGVPPDHAGGLDGDVNAAGVPRSFALARVLYPPDRLRAAAARALPDVVAGQVRRARRALVREAPVMDAGTARRLASVLGPDVLALEGLLGRSLDVWPTRRLLS